jgi:hypothetical protein
MLSRLKGKLMLVTGQMRDALQSCQDSNTAQGLASPIESIRAAADEALGAWKEFAPPQAPVWYGLDLGGELTSLWSGQSGIRMNILGCPLVLAVEGETLEVLQEVILRPVNENPDVQQSVDAREEGNSVVIVVRDNLRPFEPEEAKGINSGILLTQAGHGRAWGLSVMSLIARKGGGRIKVESAAAGNVVTVSLPLWRDGAGTEKPA